MIISPYGVFPAGCPAYFDPPQPTCPTRREKHHVNGHIVRRGKGCYMLFQPTCTRELTPAGFYGVASSAAQFSWANRLALLNLLRLQHQQQITGTSQREQAGTLTEGKVGTVSTTSTGTVPVTSVSGKRRAALVNESVEAAAAQQRQKQQGQNVQGCYELFGQLICPP